MGALFLWTLGTLAGCAPYPYGTRSLPEVKRLAREHNFELTSFQDSYAPLLIAARSGDKARLHIYIEGDGLAWRTKYDPSLDPTPADPTALRLASLDSSGACVFYVSRPGQYLEAKNLSIWDWTHRRFSEKTLGLYHRYLDSLPSPDKQKPEITLLGYSGGGTIALLLAATRSDIARVITFAGLLDTQKWVDVHGYSPLEGSLNPADFSTYLTPLEQVHLIGTDDTVVTPSVVTSYQRRFSPTAPLTVKVLPGVSHWFGWEDAWETLSNDLFGSKPVEEDPH